MKLEDLSEKQHKNLGQWISALFIAEGISEETMSSCSPQEYYLLVPTLFSQTVGACEMGKLEFDTLKGGLECEYRDIALRIIYQTDSRQIFWNRFYFHLWFSLSLG